MSTDSVELPDPSESRCSACRASMGVSAARCPACGQPSLPPETVTRAEELIGQLADRWAASPYFRGVEGASYTPRGQLRGFLTDANHPLGQALLKKLFVLSLLVEACELKRLMWVAQESFPEGAGALARSFHQLWRWNEAALLNTREFSGAARLRELIMEGAPWEDDASLEAEFRAWQELRLSGGA